MSVNESLSKILNPTKIQSILSGSLQSKILECDVILKNERRMFVGLKYDETIATAPVIIFQGDERLNSQFLKLQEENEIHYYDDRPLARELYEEFNEGDILPDKYYSYVADIYKTLPKYKKT